MTRPAGHDANRKASPSDSIFDPEVMEEKRLAALRRYDILDTEREEAFDRLTGMAADLFGVEVAFVAFLDTDRQWLRSKVGLSEKEADLAGALCTRTVEEESLLEVEDADEEKQAKQSPSAGEAGLRFYAGVPILSPGGLPIGTFSIMDPKPKALSEEERGRLQDLGEMAGDALERRREAREHERLARRFEAVLQDPNVVVGVLSPEGTLLELNDTALRYVEESKEEVLGLDLWETPWWPEETKGEVREWVERAAGGEYVDFEADLLGPGETTHSIEGRIRPVTEEDGQADTLIFSVRDVTERQRQAKRLRMLSEAVGQATEAVLITEAEPLGEPGPRVQYVNSAYEEMTGYSKEEMIGQTPRILQGPETDREVLDALREALEAEEEWQGETINYRKDGEPYQVQWNVAPVRGEDGEIEHWVSVQRDVTERREREERLRLLAEGLKQVGDKVMITDPEGEIQYVNEAFEEITGYSEEEALGKTPRLVQSGGQNEDFYEELWETLRSGDTFRAELTNERKNGTRYVEDEVITPVTGAGGQVTHFVSTGRDVTERKRRKRELERQNDLFERAQEIANVGAWEYDLQKDKSKLTDQAYRIHGLDSGNDMSPEKSLGFFHAEDRPTIRRAFRRAVEEGQSYDLEARLTTDAGEERWVRTRGEPIRENGEVARIRGTIQDVSRRKERELELERVNARLKLALESTDTGTFDWDLDTDEVTWDEASERLFGYEPGEYPETFQAWADRVHPEDLPRTEQKIERAIQQEETYDVVFRTDPPENAPATDTRWIRARGNVEYDEDGTATRMIGIHTDVTKQKRRERELIKAKEEAERMNRLKSAFLANMSHEIRTPLTSILGFAEAIGEEAGSASEPEEVDLAALSQFSSLIERSGHRLMDTLTGVLNLSKLQAGEMDLSVGPVDLAAEAEEVAQELGPQARKAGIDLKTEVGGGPVWARADEGGLQIALRNLISNAIKYTGEGGEVWVRVRQAGDMATLEVEDTGIGMDPETVSGLFEAFKQASEGVGREYEGTGLGLTVTKEVLDQMGGSIEVETEKGEGSRFTVRLPRTEATKAEDAKKT